MSIKLIRFIGINYLKNVDHSTTLDPLNMTEFDEIDRIARNVIRYWYNNLLSVIFLSKRQPHQEQFLTII